MAELLVEEHVLNPDQQSVCIREIQKSLKFSAKKLIESKIEALGVSHLFDVQMTEIRRLGGKGLIIFQGMQDHTADSIKSLEGFDRAWVEEAQSLSHRSVELLIPTIRNDGSEIWFSWNPDQPTDAVEKLLIGNDDAVVVHVNYTENRWCPAVMHKQAEWQRKADYERFAHIWLGGYNTKSEAQIFAGKWRADEFEPAPHWDGPYQGLDFGFSSHPTAYVRCWIGDNTLYIDQDCGRVGLELDDTADFINTHDPGAANHVTRADSARPESISYLRRHGMPRVAGVEKWPGSVEDGIEHLKIYDEIVIHTQCREMQEEARLYSYKVDKRSGDILPKIEDAHNHRWDACIEHGQMVATGRGLVPIESVLAGDYVHTRIGLRQVLASEMTHESAAIYELRTQSGQVLRATANHRVFVAGRGYLRMDAIRYNDSVISMEQPLWQMPSQLSTMVSCGTDIPTQSAALIANTSSGRQRPASRYTFIDMYGKASMARSLMAGTFTTETETAKTIALRILSACRRPITIASTAHGMADMPSLSSTSTESGLSQRLGTLLMKGVKSIEKLARRHTKTSFQSASPAIDVRLSSCHASSETKIATAQMHVNQQQDAHRVSITSPEYASSAATSSRSTNIGKPGFAQDRVLSVRATGQYSKVYDLMVDEAEEFFASGVLVHNCRYALAPLIKNRTGGLVLSRHR